MSDPIEVVQEHIQAVQRSDWEALKASVPTKDIVDWESFHDVALELVANTYGGYLAAMADPGWRARIGPQINDLLERMLSDGLIEPDGDRVKLTMLGRACGESPLAFESAMLLVELIRQAGPEVITPEVLMALVQALPEQDADYTRWAAANPKPADPEQP